MIFFFLKSLLLFLGFYAQGTLFYTKPSIEENFILSFYKKFFWGLIITVVGVSIYITGGKTFSLASIPLLAYWIYLNKGFSLKFEFNKIGIEILLLSIFAFIFSLLSLKINTLYGLKDELLIHPHRDILFYEEVTSFIFATGKETITLDWFNTNGLFSFYHYFDIYLNGIFKSFLNEKVNNSYIATLYPFAILLYLLGLFGLVLQYVKNTYLVLVVFLIIAGFNGIYWITYIYPEIKTTQAVFFPSLWYYPKLSLPMIASVGVAIYFLEGAYSKAYILFFIFGLLFLSIFPQLIVFSFFLLLFEKYNKRLVNNYQILIFIFSALLIVISLKLFTIELTKIYFFDYFTIKSLFNTCILNLWSKNQLIAFFLIPNGLFLFFFYKFQIKSFQNHHLSFLLIFLFAGFSTFVITSFNYESFQFWSISYAMTLPILLIILFEKFNLNSIITGVFVAIALVSSILWLKEFKFQGEQIQFKTNEITQLKKYFNKIDSKNTVYYLPKLENFDKNPYFQHIISTFGDLVPYLKPEQRLVSISNLLVHNHTYEMENYRNSSALKRFSILNNVSEKNMNQLIRKFLNKNKIDNLITRDTSDIKFLNKNEILEVLVIPSRSETYIKFKIND